jgi:hypothetical protein
MASTSAVAEAVALDQAGGYLFTGTDNGADAQTLIVRRVGADGEADQVFAAGGYAEFEYRPGAAKDTALTVTPDRNDTVVVAGAYDSYARSSTDQASAMAVTAEVFADDSTDGGKGDDGGNGDGGDDDGGGGGGAINGLLLGLELLAACLRRRSCRQPHDSPRGQLDRTLRNSCVIARPDPVRVCASLAFGDDKLGACPRNPRRLDRLLANSRPPRPPQAWWNRSRPIQAT